MPLQETEQLASDRALEFPEGAVALRRHVARWSVTRLLGGQLVVSAATILDERMPDEHHPGAAVLLEARIGGSQAFSRL